MSGLGGMQELYRGARVWRGVLVGGDEGARREG